MASKYQSNVKTYIARNFIWDTSASLVVPHALAAPADLVISEVAPRIDFMKQPFRMNWGYTGNGLRFNKQGGLFIRRMGVFSNFADGLVLQNTASRLDLAIAISKISIASQTGAVTFTAGSNQITSTVDLNTFYTAGDGFICDGAAFDGNIYYVYNIAVDGLSAFIGDYAYRTAVSASVFTVPEVFGASYGIEIGEIPVFNELFDVEIYFNSGAFAPSASQEILVYTQPPLVQGDDSLTMYTKSIDTAFNGSPVTFDCVMEAEITPVPLS